MFPPNPVSFPDLPRVRANLYKYYFSKPRSCKESVAMSLGLLWSLTVAWSIALLSGWELYDLIFNWAWSRKDRKISYSLTGDFYSRQLCSKPPRRFGSVYPTRKLPFSCKFYFYNILLLCPTHSIPLPPSRLHPCYLLVLLLQCFPSVNTWPLPFLFSLPPNTWIKFEINIF